MLSYEKIRGIVYKLNPETAHDLAEFGMRFVSNFIPALLNPFANKYFVHDERLEQTILGMKFLNPVGIGAGFDKNATMFKALTALGFGYIEFGTVTPKPQNGNDKPRLFRFIEEESLQNAMGFNNDGMEKIAKRVKKLYPYTTPLGANIGKNKTTSQENAIDDYKNLTSVFSSISDYLVINISSPNTPNLRDLQNKTFVHELFSELVKLTNKPIFLKIAPDMSLKDAVSLSQNAIEHGAKGIIATNTTIDYSILKGAKNFGGISGKVLKEKSFEFFNGLSKELYKHSVLISVGGIDSAEDVYKRLKTGANLVQIYSSFIFKGPGICRDINSNLLKLMQRDGFNHISELIGSDR